MILKVEGDVLSGFRVLGEKIDFHESGEGNVDFFLPRPREWVFEFEAHERNGLHWFQTSYI
jgi:hypothetical protein